ncbi:MAG: class I tRNA ligase family protein [bacterium]|nr:class I tRNA ligase family protein [bacterium]
MKEFPKTYDQSHEAELYKLWESSGYFNPDGLSGKSYTVIMPPPNANGKLHIGHALGLTLEDIMIRYQRMRGRKTLWLPGTDHAGFETQVVFEKKLEKEGRSRFELKREEFYKQVMNFVQENKQLTEEGMRRLGASCDWSRNIFTLDPRIIKIVYETFEQMYKDGLVYRGSRICNWCSRHQTALSELETKHEKRKDKFYYLKYGPFTIGTARPETKFGDKYVVIHPNDPRYKKYKHGQKIEVEWINGKVKATIIKDKAVDPDFGTGVMTITPWHDATDFEIAQRHNLDFEQIIDKKGKLLPIAGEFDGLYINKARPLIVGKLQQKGLLEKTDLDYEHNIQLCYKCNTIIEPQILPQWYVAMTKTTAKHKSLRDMAIESVKNKKIKINPAKFEKVFMHWMKNLYDWPISRQIWWGIPIPAWYCGGVEKVSPQKMGFHPSIVPELIKKDKGRTYRLRDHNLKLADQFMFEDSGSQTLLGRGVITNVIKTTVGKIKLPDMIHSGKYKTTAELIAAFQRMYPGKKVGRNTPAIIYDYEFYPLSKDCGQVVISEKQPKQCPACGGDNLIQDPDTFDTWFSSGQWPFAALQAQSKEDYKTFYPTSVMETGWDILFFWVARMIMLGLYKTGEVPFKHVYLHGLIRDKDRQKMSKSKGNVVDPLGVIDQYGVDALRMALIVGNLPGNDIVISEEKVRGYRNFANKIWNASRYVLQNLHDFNEDDPVKLTTEDKAILDDLNKIVKKVTKEIDKHDFAHAVENLYHYFWHTFADKVIEQAKPKLEDEKLRKSAQYTIYTVLTISLKLLHPFMPFVTESIWQLNNNQSRLGDPASNRAEQGERAQARDLLMMQKWPK